MSVAHVSAVPVQAWIRDHALDAHHVTYYTIVVMRGDEEAWAVRRRYSEFESLHKRLQRDPLPPMPRKSPFAKRVCCVIFGADRLSFLDDRQDQLDEILQSALRADPHLWDPVLFAFLSEASMPVAHPVARPVGAGLGAPLALLGTPAAPAVPVATAGIRGAGPPLALRGTPAAPAVPVATAGVLAHPSVPDEVGCYAQGLPSLLQPQQLRMQSTVTASPAAAAPSFQDRGAALLGRCGLNASREKGRRDREYRQFLGIELGDAPPHHESGARVGGLPGTALPWGIVCGSLPAMLAAFGFYCQSVGLHYATYSYVHKYAMSDAEADLGKDYITLRDPVEDMLEHRVQELGFIDTLAVAFPMVFGLASCCFALCANDGLRKKVLVLWTKVMICAYCLFSLKGLLGACTTVPDSRGWGTCKSQSLVPEAVDWMRGDHAFWEFLILDFWWVAKHGKPMRYCADMMFSGHTFTVTLFALGLYELARVLLSEMREATGRRGRHWRRVARILTLTAIGLVTIAQQCFEVYAVETSHFHYTADVLVAFLVTLLIYSNSVTCVAAETWARTCRDASGQHFWSLLGCGASPSAKALEVEAFEQQLASESMKCDDADVAKLFEGRDHLTKQDADRWVWLAMDSKADVFVPPCCFPCCGTTGRQHMYTDEGLEALLKQHALLRLDHAASTRPQEALEQAALLYLYMDQRLQEARNYKDGVTMRDLLDSAQRLASGQCKPDTAAPLFSSTPLLSH